MALDDETLRDAASHRGLKLIKSRKRKAGVGDYGLFGLVDSAGKALFGVGGDGLTATARQIADYLRKGEASTWAESAKVTPARARDEAPERRASSDDDTPPPSAIKPRPRRSERPAGQSDRAPKPAAKSMPPEPEPAPRKPSSKPASKPAQRLEVESEKAPPPAVLVIRKARPADADAIRVLMTDIGFAGTKQEMARALAAATARKEPVLVADRDAVIGVLVWHIVPTLQVGRIARITAIVVDENERRAGIGRALYEAASDEWAKRKVTIIEAMSEIAVRNANGFFRALGFEQASYRFVASA